MNKSLNELLLSRQSVRRYNPSRKVDRFLIEQCIEAARIAPSACNSQPWKFIVVDQEDIKNKVAVETYGTLLRFNKFVKDSPVIIVITIEKSNFTSKMGINIKKIDYPLIDIGIAASQFCLKAEEIGIGTCMIGWFNEKPIKKALDIPDERKIALLISLGYAIDNYKLRQKQRKATKVMSSYNKY